MVPVELQPKLGRKVFSTPVWQVEKDEAAALAWPEVQKFEAMIERARTGKFVPIVEMEALGPPQPLVPTLEIRGIRNDASETTFPKLIAEWARKKRIDNPRTRRRAETHFEALADFLGHDNGADVTSRDIVRFEKHLETTPDPRTGKLRHHNTILFYLSSFKGVFKIAVQSILIDTNPMDKVAVGSKIESKTAALFGQRRDPDLDPRTGGDRRHLPAAPGASVYRVPGVGDRRLQYARFQFCEERRPREGDTGKMVPVYQRGSP